MAVMHLRLEHPDTMVVTATPAQQSSSDKMSSTETSMVVATPSEDQAAEGGDASSEAEDAVVARKLSVDSTSEDDELYRVPSMNLATDPTLWVGDATLGLGAPPGRKTSDGGGGINPFDSSSEEEDDDGAAQARVGAWAGGPENGGELDTSLEAPGRRPLANRTNPFDFSFLDSKDTAAAAAGATACSRDGSTDSRPAGGATPVEAAAVFPNTTTALSGSQSSRIGEIFPVGQVVPGTVATPSAAGIASAGTQEAAWPVAVDSSIPPNLDQLLLTSGAPPPVQTWDLPPADSPSTAMTSLASPLDSPGMPLTFSTNAASLPFPIPASAAAEEPGVAIAPPNKCLPPTPLLAFGAEGASASPCPTQPVTPFAVPSAKTPADVRDRAGAPSPSASQEPEDLFSAFRDTSEAAQAALSKEQATGTMFSAVRDGTEKEHMDLHLAFRDNTAGGASSPRACLPALPPQPGSPQPEQPQQSALPEPRGLMDEADSSRRLQNFNPFGRTGSFVLSQTPSQAPMEETAPPSGRVRQMSSSAQSAPTPLLILLNNNSRGPLPEMGSGTAVRLETCSSLSGKTFFRQPDTSRGTRPIPYTFNNAAISKNDNARFLLSFTRAHIFQHRSL